jgi:hypothetical protein
VVITQVAVAVVAVIIQVMLVAAAQVVVLLAEIPQQTDLVALQILAVVAVMVAAVTVF